MSKATQLLEKFNTKSLNILEEMQFNFHAKTSGKAGALQLLINNTEGDYSQLSRGLQKIAVKLENL